MAVNDDLMDQLKKIVEDYNHLHPRDRTSPRSALRFLAVEAIDRIRTLEHALVRFGDRGRMATTEPPALQLAIDLAFHNEAGRR